MSAEIHLIDRLEEASSEAPAPGYVVVQAITIDRQTRMSLFQHPPSQVIFSRLTLGTAARLRLGLGLKDACWDLIRSPVVFRVLLRDQRGREHPLLECALDARPGGQGRRWRDEVLDLARFRKQTVSLTFITAVPDGHDASYAWAGWSDPVLEHEAPLSRPVIRKDRNRHVVLITSDALRADHLGCYGHPFIRTPHLDDLARDGCQFVDGRAQGPTTLGSYASILTSQYATVHGIQAEWGRIRPGLATLPACLQAHGYNTLCAPSEAETADPVMGLANLFRDTIPCLGAPVQSGELTVRRFIDWLDRRPDGPFFAWVQFFDTHPPATPPEPFRSMYYRGDPTEEIRRFNPEAVGRIRGLESLLKFIAIQDTLDRGVIDTDLIVRLGDTADVLTGKLEVGPDLVKHLQALGPVACRGLSLGDFGDWLAACVRQLRRGLVEPELSVWIRSVLPLLARIEADVLSWLRGVVDFRYPLAQYQGEVSHLDHHVGRLVAALRERDLYDQSLLVFTSPHGELLDEHGTYFHHHALAEEVLSVPLLIKPSGRTPFTRGARLPGIFDHIDLTPTLLEALDLPRPSGMCGVSRWRNILTGAPVAEHDSIAVDSHQAMAALTRPPYVFLKAWAPVVTSPGWTWKEGDRGLFELGRPMDYTRNLLDSRPAIARAMEGRLDQWLDAMQTTTTGRAA